MNQNNKLSSNSPTEDFDAMQIEQPQNNNSNNIPLQDANFFNNIPPQQYNSVFVPQQVQQPQQYQQYQQPQQFPMQMQQQYSQIPQQQQYSQIPQQQQYMQSPQIYQQHLHGSSNQPIKLINDKEEDKQKEVVAIIVTINSNGSYDHLFASVEQKSEEGTRVLVYQLESTYIQNLIKAFEGNPQDDIAKEMMVHIGKLHADCVVFNWECCGFYASENFQEGKENVFKFLKIILDKGHMAMFSDFSLKALIKQWNSDVLGPNPFVKTAQTSSPIDMRFNAGQLKECPSAQLQIVGEMAEGGCCNISVLGGTICYSVNPDNLNHQLYKLKVLSVATTSIPANPKYICSIGQFKGSACHVLLTFPSGGLILTSMGHWIELMKIDTSQKKLFEVAQQNFGKEYAVQMQNQYASLNVADQRAYVSSNAVRFVQNQAPCGNMSKKAKKNF